MTKRHLTLLLALALPSCGGGSSPTSSSTPAPGGSASGVTCTASGEISYVHDVLQQYYYWYKNLPNPDPTGLASPEAYLEAVRYKPIDTTYSYITAKATSDAFYSDSQYIGFGLAYKQTGNLEMRVTQVFPGSPMADAGLDRGHYLVSVRGKAIGDLIQSGEIA